jgi:hypothetical protein
MEPIEGPPPVAEPAIDVNKPAIRVDGEDRPVVDPVVTAQPPPPLLLFMQRRPKPGRATGILRQQMGAVGVGDEQQHRLLVDDRVLGQPVGDLLVIERDEPCDRLRLACPFGQKVARIIGVVGIVVFVAQAQQLHPHRFRQRVVRDQGAQVPDAAA